MKLDDEDAPKRHKQISAASAKIQTPHSGILV